MRDNDQDKSEWLNHLNNWVFMDTIHGDLLDAKNSLYDLHGFKCSQPIMEPESKEYGAYTFEIDGFFIRFRVAKITPTKVGQFVTLWKRFEKKPIQPYDVSDPVDFYIVSTRKADRFGQFIFPKDVLAKHGILSIDGKGGKRAMRVYPPWDITINRQAQKTQKWQLEYFVAISPHIDNESDCDLRRKPLINKIITRHRYCCTK